MSDDRAAALMASNLLADVAEEHRQHVVAEILHRHAISPQTPIATIAVDLKTEEPWWLAPKPTGPNPFSLTTFNLTEASRLMRADPDLARRLQLEAGA